MLSNESKKREKEKASIVQGCAQRIINKSIKTVSFIKERVAAELSLGIDAKWSANPVSFSLPNAFKDWIVYYSLDSGFYFKHIFDEIVKINIPLRQNKKSLGDIIDILRIQFDAAELENLALLIEKGIDDVYNVFSEKFKSDQDNYAQNLTPESARRLVNTVFSQTADLASKDSVERTIKHFLDTCSMLPGEKRIFGPSTGDTEVIQSLKGRK